METLSALLTVVMGIHLSPVDSPDTEQILRKFYVYLNFAGG